MRGTRLQNRAALITGAARGIGKAIALRFAAEGAQLALIDLDAEALAQTCAALREQGASVIALAADATEEASATALTSAALKEYGRIDVLVNNLGGGRQGRLWEISAEDWDFVMRLNLRSMFLFTRAVVPHMIAARRGRVICLSSGARHGTPWNACYFGAAAYATAKAGVHGFIRDLALELSEHGINVNAVAPGPIDTELAGPFLRSLDARNLEFGPSRMTPLRRLGEPREVADAVLYLAGDESTYVTGITLDVTGGR